MTGPKSNVAIKLDTELNKQCASRAEWSLEERKDVHGHTHCSERGASRQDCGGRRMLRTHWIRMNPVPILALVAFVRNIAESSTSSDKEPFVVCPPQQCSSLCGRLQDVHCELLVLLLLLAVSLWERPKDA